VPTIVYAGGSDNLADVSDVNWLNQTVPSIYRYKILEGFTHSSFNSFASPEYEIFY